MSLLIKANLKDSASGLDVDLRLPSQGITVITGRSGAGKTTLLRLIAGLETHPSLQILWKDGRFTERTPTWRRGVGFVFQEASLFPHLSVQDNLIFGQGPTPHPNWNHWIEVLKLKPLLNARPDTLSGGERQRVALGRALIARPQLLLLDEPFSAIDETHRRDLVGLLNELRQSGLPMIYVTHRLDDITALGDHLIVMEGGRIVAEGAPNEVLAKSNTLASLDEARGVMIEAKITEIDAPWHLAQASFSGGGLWVRQSDLTAGQSVRLHIAARDVSLSLQRPEASSIQNILPVEILDITPFEDISRVFVRLKAGDTLICADITARARHQLGLQSGDRLFAQIKSVALHH